jgi:competence protein ComEC
LPIELGDHITFSGKLTERALQTDGKIFYYTLADKIKYSAFINASEITVIKGDKTIFQKINLAVKDTLNSGMNKDEFPVAYALICGNSDFIDYEILTSFRQSGVAHIFAVSGMHVGFLAVILNYLLTKFRVNKCVKTVSIVGILLFYSGICNFTPS